jgi:hypothetical protein
MAEGGAIALHQRGSGAAMEDATSVGYRRTAAVPPAGGVDPLEGLPWEAPLSEWRDLTLAALENCHGQNGSDPE